MCPLDTAIKKKRGSCKPFNLFTTHTLYTHTHTHTGCIGYLSWSRYLVVHPHYTPSRCLRVCVHIYIITMFILPFLCAWLFVFIFSHTETGTLDLSDVSDPYVLTTWVGLTVYFVAIPARVLFDVV